MKTKAITLLVNISMICLRQHRNPRFACWSIYRNGNSRPYGKYAENNRNIFGSRYCSGIMHYIHFFSFYPQWWKMPLICSMVQYTSTVIIYVQHVSFFSSKNNPKRAVQLHMYIWEGMFWTKFFGCMLYIDGPTDEPTYHLTCAKKYTPSSSMGGINISFFHRFSSYFLGVCNTWLQFIHKQLWQI